MLAATETTRVKQIKTLKKVIMWRIVSVSLTYLITFIYTGDLKSATAFTFFLHAILMTANYILKFYGISMTAHKNDSAIRQFLNDLLAKDLSPDVIDLIDDFRQKLFIQSQLTFTATALAVSIMLTIWVTTLPS